MRRIDNRRRSHQNREQLLRWGLRGSIMPCVPEFRLEEPAIEKFSAALKEFMRLGSANANRDPLKDSDDFSIRRRNCCEYKIPIKRAESLFRELSELGTIIGRALPYFYVVFEGRLSFSPLLEQYLARDSTSSIRPISIRDLIRAIKANLRRNKEGCCLPPNN